MEPELAAELAAHDEAVAIAMEEKRRAAMFEKANVQKDVPFKIGEVVFEQEQPGAARVERGGAHHLRALAELGVVRARLLAARQLPRRSADVGAR